MVYVNKIVVGLIQFMNDKIIFLVSGSRMIRNYRYIAKILSGFIQKDKHIVIFGDAKGVDQLTEKYCVLHKIKHHKPYKPNWKRYKNSAGAIRNKEMVDICDVGICIGSTNGTMITKEFLEKSGKLLAHITEDVW